MPMLKKRIVFGTAQPVPESPSKVILKSPSAYNVTIENQDELEELEETLLEEEHVAGYLAGYESKSELYRCFSIIFLVI